MMKVSIHQPETYPQLGYFNKIYESDLFVLLDSVSYRKNYFQNRNRVCSKAGDVWMTLPVSGGDLIQERSYERKALVKHEKTISNIYGKGHVQDQLIGLIRRSDEVAEGNLAEFNSKFILGICEMMRIETKFIRSSELEPESAKSELVLELCRKTGATVYLSGVSGRDYLDLSRFQAAGIDVWFQKFNYPVYPQNGEVFNKYASVIDVMCINGVEKTANFVKNGNWEKE